MSKFYLRYDESKEKAGIKEDILSDQIIHSWIQLGLIERKKNYHSLYSNNSVEQLKLCAKLRLNYGKNTNKMRILLNDYFLSYLSERLERISCEELSNMIYKAKEK